MSPGHPPVHSVVSTRTLFVAISGFGAAALVTSLSVLLVDAIDPAIRIAVMGGTAVLGISSLVVARCTFVLPRGDDRSTWALIAVALALTTLGSGLRASSFRSDWAGVAPEAGEAVYVAGLFILMGAMVLWPLVHRHGANLVVALAGAVVSTALGTLVFWVFAGGDLVQSAFAGAAMGPVRLRQLLGLMVFMTLVATFCAASAYVLRQQARSAPQAMVALALLAIVGGDIYWLSQMAGPGWTPGAFGDFIHLAGHVLVAVAASLALDVTRSESAF